MRSAQHDPVRDLVIVGGGLSGSLTLLSLAEELERGATRPRRVTVVDQAGDFGGGAPYGARAHPSYLLNENAATMDVRGFRDWLLRRRDDWTSALRERGGSAVESWFRFNAAALERAREDPAAFDAMFLPRCVFGAFVRERLASTLERVERRGVLCAELVTAEALAVRRRADALHVELRDAPPLRADAVLLALGSPAPDPAPHLAGCAGYVHTPYAHDFEALRRTLLAALQRSDAARRSRRVLLLGSNAAAMEFLYSVANDASLDAAIEEVLVLSTGTVPDARPSGNERAFAPRALQELARTPRPSAQQVWEAARRDVGRARADGYTSLDFAGPVGDALGALLGAMTLAERRRFVERHGRSLTALRFHTPPEYADAAARLVRASKLAFRAARVDAVTEESSAAGRLAVEAVSGGRRDRYDGAAVVNCRGSGRLARTQAPLLRGVLRPGSGIARRNASGLGIEVSPELEASRGVFVLGPLLGGHASKDLAIWNLESAPRIDVLAARLGATLAKRWSTLGDVSSARRPRRTAAAVRAG